MKRLSRVWPLFLGAALVMCLAVSTSAQTAKSEPSPFTGAVVPEYARVAPVSLAAAPGGTASSGMILKFPTNAATSRGIFTVRTTAGSGSGNGKVGTASAIAHSNPNGNIAGLQTVPAFAGAFAAEGGPAQGFVFPYVMMGNNPQLGGTTTIPAAVTLIDLLLDNVPAGFSPNIPYQFGDLTEDSPNFQGALYTDGNQIQFADAIQRAEFFNTMATDWHTNLSYHQVDRVTIEIPRFVNVQFPDGSVKAVQAYYVGTAPDGTQFIELLDLLFNFFYFNQAVNDINANLYQTNAFNYQLWPNTYLFSIDLNGNPAGCCVLGFHEYIYEPGVVPQPTWIFAFASWISPGLFRGGAQDVTAISHETSEAFNDPFVSNSVPAWQFPGIPGACQGNLETGDPVEVLASTTFPVPLKEGQEVFVYHPQTEALLQWFEMGATSDAIGGAFSYPNTSALPQSATPCPTGP